MNGVPTLSTSLDRFIGKPQATAGLTRTSGRIGFHNWDGNTRFRNIEINEFERP